MKNIPLFIGMLCGLILVAVINPFEISRPMEAFAERAYFMSLGFWCATFLGDHTALAKREERAK